MININIDADVMLIIVIYKIKRREIPVQTYKALSGPNPKCPYHQWYACTAGENAVNVPWGGAHSVPVPNARG